MFIGEVIGPYIGVFIEWGFLMAFLYNLVSRLNNPDKAIVQLAFIMTLSYLLSGTFQLSNNYYFNCIWYDTLTLVFIVSWVFFFKVKSFPALFYILIGLICNTVLVSVIYYDVYMLENRTPWWFWGVYSFGVNALDLMMILSLIFNRDYLFFSSRKVSTPSLR